MRSVSERSHSSRSSQERKKTDYYINEVYSNVSHQYDRASHTEKSIYCRYINSYPDILPNCNCVFDCCGNYRKIKIPE